MLHARDFQQTHIIQNQVPSLPDYNLLRTDIALLEGLRREGAARHETSLADWGERLGRQELFRQAALANSNPPVLHAFDRLGWRIDSVEFHPAWHTFLGLAFAQGMHGSAWTHPGPGAHVARAVHYLMHGQLEAGSLCPVTMTSAAIPLLAAEPWFDEIRSRLASREYDPADRPVQQKASMMIGMGLTEKQGGSDLRSNSSKAESIASAPGWFRLTGHKWFCSSPTSDAHLMLALEEGGEEGQHSCFYVPRWLDDGSRNPVHIQRLKDKLGNRSNASAEIEFAGALGRRIGEPGRGIALLLQMAAYTRMDCVLGSSALLRQMLVQGIHHARYRRAFGRRLIDQALMEHVLLDLVLESEAATALALHLAAAFDSDHPAQSFLRRILTPAAKFWVCKRTIEAAGECMEVWGGNGYIEDGPMARLYRVAPVNSIWEGSGNVMCLDVLRAANRDPDSLHHLVQAVMAAHADNASVRTTAERILHCAGLEGEAQQRFARRMAQDLVLLVQADLLLRHAPSPLARAFVDSRLSDNAAGRVFGTQMPKKQAAALLQRAWPE